MKQSLLRLPRRFAPRNDRHCESQAERNDSREEKIAAPSMTARNDRHCESQAERNDSRGEKIAAPSMTARNDKRLNMAGREKKRSVLK